MKLTISFVFISFSVLFLGGCSSGISMKSVDLDSFFNDNSSKVWLVNNLRQDGKDIASVSNELKDVFIFYKSGRIAVQPINSLGKQPIMIGHFYIDSDLKTMKLEINEANWNFDIEELSREKVVLSPQKSSDFQYGVVLIPLPEF